MNGWAQRILGGMMPVNQQNVPYPQVMNPMQMMGNVMQAMRNPMAFVRQRLPGIPEEVFKDPTGNGVLQYMMQNMGVTQQDVQNAANQIPKY